MSVNVKELKERLEAVYGDLSKLPKEKSIENAIKIYKDVKKYEKHDIEGKVDHNKESIEAKYDLLIIFEIGYAGLTKNKIYLAHQSAWVNTLYMMLSKGEI